MQASFRHTAVDWDFRKRFDTNDRRLWKLALPKPPAGLIKCAFDGRPLPLAISHGYASTSKAKSDAETAGRMGVRETNQATRPHPAKVVYMIDLP